MLINDFKEREIKLVAKCDGIVEFLSTDELKLVSKGEVFDVHLPAKDVLLLGFKENELV
jgi:hypothetical protein